MAGGPVPTSLDRPDRPRLRVEDAKAAAEGLAEEMAAGRFPEMEGVRQVLADYVDQHDADDDKGWVD
jgi:hypothetical protein